MLCYIEQPVLSPCIKHIFVRETMPGIGTMISLKAKRLVQNIGSLLECKHFSLTDVES